MQDREKPKPRDWDDIRVFLAAFREKSLGAAALRLGVDTSTVSRRLTTLEEATGLRLFDRSREGLRATHAARAMLPAAEAMEAAHARLARDASDASERVEGTVRISMAPGVADVFVAPLLVDLRARHPRLTLELDASVRALDLTRREADLALRSIAPVGAELVTRKLARAPWVAAGSPVLVKTLGRLRSWTAAPWVAWDHDLARMHVSRWLAAHVPKADVALRTSHFASQLVALETGLGIGLVAEPYLAARGLLPVRLGRELAPSARALPVDDLWIVGHRALRDVPRVAAVWTFLLERLTLRAAALPAPRRDASARARGLQHRFPHADERLGFRVVE